MTLFGDEDERCETQSPWDHYRDFSICPEIDGSGNIEYKLKLATTSPLRLEKLITQLRWRLTEGSGTALYEIGVMDDGSLHGLNEQDAAESIRTVQTMLGQLGGGTTRIRRVVRLYMDGGERRIALHDSHPLLESICDTSVSASLKDPVQTPPRWRYEAPRPKATALRPDMPQNAVDKTQRALMRRERRDQRRKAKANAMPAVSDLTTMLEHYSISSPAATGLSHMSTSVDDTRYVVELEVTLLHWAMRSPDTADALPDATGTDSLFELDLDPLPEGEGWSYLNFDSISL